MNFSSSIVLKKTFIFEEDYSNCQLLSVWNDLLVFFLILIAISLRNYSPLKLKASPRLATLLKLPIFQWFFSIAVQDLCSRGILQVTTFQYAYFRVNFLFDSIKIDNALTEGFKTSNLIESLPFFKMRFLLTQKFMHSKRWLAKVLKLLQTSNITVPNFLHFILFINLFFIVLLKFNKTIYVHLLVLVVWKSI